MKRTILLIITALIILSFSSCTTDKLSWYEKLPEKHKSVEMQKQRKGMINKLINKYNVIYEIKPYDIYDNEDPYIIVYVDSAFYGLKFEDKKTFMNLVGMYYFVKAKERGILTLKDANSGKEIGTFSKYGLDMN